MYHQPYKKQQKKVQEVDRSNRNVSGQKVNFIQKNKQVQSKKKIGQKTAINTTIPKPSLKGPQKTIPQKVEHLEKAVEKLSKGTGNPDLQRQLLEEIKSIKSQLKEIKQQIGINPNSGSKKYQRPSNYEEEQVEQEQNIANMIPRDEPEVSHSQLGGRGQKIQSGTYIQQQQNNRSQRFQPVSYEVQIKKELIDIGKIQPYMKQFKLEPTKLLLPIYRGYHKKSSKPIVIKYCSENESMDGLINLYQKFWKNIVKAKKVCINKIYDLNEPLANNILALEMNKLSINQIQLQPLQIIKQVFRGIQFFHECGYLYRNIHPAHVMMSFEGNIVLLDLKLARRFIDMRGKLLQVKGQLQKEGTTQFISNARLRGIPQGRKDDFQCLGYLALYLLQGKLPWNLGNMIQIRTKVTLQNLFGRYPSLLEFMINIHKMATEETPSYDKLYSLITI